MLFSLLIILLYLNVSTYCDKVDVDVDAYCKLKCNEQGVKHTICEYKCELAKECVEYKNLPLSDADRQYILDLHNNYRNIVASGKDTRGGNNKAKNMMVMNYDKDIEITTLCWIRRCVFAHDKCRQHLKYSSAGQNLYQGSSTSDKTDYGTKSYLNASANGWYEEIRDTTEDLIKKFGKHPKMIGHFTQMVWASSKFIGCSRISFKNPKEKLPYQGHIFCNYSPAGNWLGAAVYEFGSGCSKEKPNSEYPALCGELKVLSSDRDKNIPTPKPSCAQRNCQHIFIILIILVVQLLIVGLNCK